jgi:hypothetical protein
VANVVVAALCAAGCSDNGSGGGESGSSATSTGSADVTSSTPPGSSTGSTGGTGGGDSGSSAGTTGGSESTDDSSGTPDPHCGWEHTHDGDLQLHDSASAVAVAPDGSIVVVGSEETTAEPGQPRDYQPWIRKLTVDGVEDWTVRVEAPAGESSGAGARGVVIDDGGLIYVGGNGGMDTPDGWVRQLSPAGDPGWLLTTEATVSGLALEGSTMVAAGSIPVPATLSDAWLARLDPSDGTEVWSDTRSAANGGPAQGFAVVLVGGSLAVVVGHDRDPSVPYPGDGLIAVWDIDGAFQWSDVIAPGGDRPGRASDVAATPGGDIVVTGEVRVTGGELDQLWLRAYDTSGVEAWTVVWGENEGTSPGYERGSAVVAEPGGDLFVGGQRAVGDNGYQMLLQRRSPDGSLLWTEEWGAEGNPWDGVSALVLATPTRLILAGQIGGTDEYMDAWVACWPDSGMP